MSRQGTLGLFIGDPPAETLAGRPELTSLRRHHDAQRARPGRPRARPPRHVSSCRHDPARALVPVLTAMPANGIPPAGILADSGYAHRDADAWAIPLRRAGVSLVQDLHPHDRGPKGTHNGAIIANGTCTAPRPRAPPLEPGPLGPAPSSATSGSSRPGTHGRKETSAGPQVGPAPQNPAPPPQETLTAIAAAGPP